MMERLVRDPLRSTGHIGTVASVIMLVAVFGLGAPREIFVPISVGALLLVMHIGLRADRRNREHESD